MAKRAPVTSASTALLRWFTNAGPDVAEPIRVILLGHLFSSPKVIVLTLLNGLVLNVMGILLKHEAVFVILLILDVLLTITRVWVVRRTAQARERNLPTPTDLHVVLTMLWCLLQGSIAFTMMLTGDQTLQILAAASTMAILGPIAARNYAAPRLMMLYVCLCDLPMKLGAVLSGNPWMWVLACETPLFLYATVNISRSFRGLSILSLQAEQDSAYRAEHDPLTGLLNRSGLTEALSAIERTSPARFILFYLDLDGFKQVNDTFGHQAGDSLLKAVADRLRSNVRASDVVARLGGDEFVFLARDLAPGAGPGFAEDIIRRVTEEPFAIEFAGDVRVGVSVGFACAPEDGTVMQDLHGKADVALYAAKNAGRGVQRRYKEFEITPTARAA